MQKAFDLADKWQIPVLVLSEKFIADSMQVVSRNAFESLPVERYLESSSSDLVSEMRYGLSENGVSPRWIPGSNKVPYFANGDEHFIDGRLTEDALKSRLMIDKRARKIDYIVAELPEPEVIGESDAEIVLVGFGSTKMVVEDAIQVLEDDGVHVSYIHYSYLHPLKTEVLISKFQSGARVFLLEGNRSGQFGECIEAELKTRVFEDKLLKYDGRPFYLNEVVEFVKSKLK
jgi:2-oxoglutarate ferredoxin oxidoreductase subunit alpha